MLATSVVTCRRCVGTDQNNIIEFCPATKHQKEVTPLVLIMEGSVAKLATLHLPYAWLVSSFFSPANSYTPHTSQTQ